MSWSPKAIARVHALYKDGLSYRQITAALAEEGLGVVSRNAISGLVSRKSWAKRLAPPRAAKPKPTPKIRIPKPPKPLAITQAEGERLEPLHDLLGRPIAGSVSQLKSGQCRWPIGDPAEASFGFCAREADTNTPRDPYCACHRAITRRPGTAYQKRRAA